MASMVFVSDSLPEPIPCSQHQENISQQTLSEKGDCKNASKQATSECMHKDGQKLDASLSAGEKHVDIKCKGSVIKVQAKAIMEPSNAAAQTKDSDNYASVGNSMEMIHLEKENCETKRKLETVENYNKRMKEMHGDEKPDVECSVGSSAVEHVNTCGQLNLTNSQDIGDQRTESTDSLTSTTNRDHFVFGRGDSCEISETQGNVSVVTPSQSGLVTIDKCSTTIETPPNGSSIHVESQDDLQSSKNEDKAEDDMDTAEGDNTQPDNTDINQNNGTLEQVDHIANVDDRRQTKSQTKNLNNTSNEDKKAKQVYMHIYIVNEIVHHQH